MENKPNEGEVPLNENILRMMPPELGKRRQEEIDHKKQLEGKILSDLIPSIGKIAPGFTTAGHAANGLSEMIRLGIETLAKKTKIKDLGLLEHLEIFDKADPVKAQKFAEQKLILEAIGDWTVDEGMWAIGWLNIKINAFTEKALSSTKTESFLSELLDNIQAFENANKDQAQGIASPYTGENPKKEES